MREQMTLLNAVGTKLIRYKEAAAIFLAGSTTVVVMTVAGGVAEKTVEFPPTIPKESRAPTSSVRPTTSTTTTTTTTETFPQTSVTTQPVIPPTTTGIIPANVSPTTTGANPTGTTATTNPTTTTNNPRPPATHKCRNHNDHCKAPPIPPGQEKKLGGKSHRLAIRSSISDDNSRRCLVGDKLTCITKPGNSSNNLQTIRDIIFWILEAVT